MEKKAKPFLSIFLLCVILVTVKISFDNKDLKAKNSNFLSIKASECNIRKGPGRNYIVKKTVHAKHFPVQKTKEFDRWCKVTLPNKYQGWIHQSLLSNNQTRIIKSGARQDKAVKVYFLPALFAYSKVRIENNAVVKLLKGKFMNWQKISYIYAGKAHNGWVQTSFLKTGF